MRYLKRFNEELKPETYISAAKKLKSIGGHDKRAAGLEEWGNLERQKEEDRQIKAIVDRYSKHGTFRVNIAHSMSQLRSKDFLMAGDFYICIDFMQDWAAENFNDWMDGGREDSALWIPLMIGLIPANEETLNNMKSCELEMWRNTCWTSNAGAFLSYSIQEEGSYEDGDWDLKTARTDGGGFYIEQHQYDIRFASRRDAMKFKKLLVDIFEGNTEMGEDASNPGGIKEEMIEYYCSKSHVPIEAFDDIADNMRKLSLNKLYMD